MLKPGVTNLQVVIPTKVVEREVVVVIVQPLLRKGNAVGPDDVEATSECNELQDAQLYARVTKHRDNRGCKCAASPLRR